MPPKSGEISASVEESNKLRAKLGIKPLATDDDKGAKKGTSNDPVHAPGGKMPDEPPPEPDAKELKAQKKAARLHKDLVSGKGLGDELADQGQEGKGSASDWVMRTRNKDGSMKGAEEAKEKAKKEEEARKRKANKEPESVPKGMKVRHDSDAIGDGESMVMTLSDQKLLDKDGKLIEHQDEISNVNLLDSERAKHNEAVRNQKDYDRDLEGQGILQKYDELKTGPTGFIVGGQAVGPIGETDPEKRLALLTKISEEVTLETKLKMQSDYFTPDEMAAKFRKPPKRKAKKRKGDTGDKDDHIGDPKAMATLPRPEDAGSDEEDPELYEQLSKQRRLVKRSDAGAMKKGEAALAQVSDRIQAVEADNDDEKKEEKEEIVLGGKPKEGDHIAMTATTEFCNVVQTPIEKMDTMKHESFRGSTLYKQQVTARKGIAAGERKARRAGMAANESGEVNTVGKDEIEEATEMLTEEGLDLSCASGLAYLRARSQIGIDQETHRNRKSDNRPLEMSTVDGDIKLEYRDDFGRVQTPKEAFRAISWKFHGKTPGRKNMERRLLRLENEMKLKAMNPMEQLPTLRALRHVQSADAKPYMVLSGANEK